MSCYSCLVLYFHGISNLDISKYFLGPSSGFQECFAPLEHFSKIVNGYQPLSIFVKSFILDVRMGSEYASKQNICSDELKIFHIYSSVFSLHVLVNNVIKSSKKKKDKKKLKQKQKCKQRFNKTSSSNKIYKKSCNIKPYSKNVLHFWDLQVSKLFKTE